MRTQKALLISFSIHLGMLALFLLYVPRPNLPVLIPSAKEFLVVLEDQGSQSGQSTSQNKARPGERAVHGKPKQPLRLGLTDQDHAPTGLSQVDLAAGAEPVLDVDAFAREMSLAEESEYQRYFNTLWRRVDASLTYPEDFVKQRIEGSVFVHMVLDERGVFGGDILKIEGSNSMLNTFVLVTLIHTLGEPLPQKDWAEREEMPVAFRVDFKLFGWGGVAKVNRRAHFKNALFFERKARSESVIDELYKKIVTRYIPPILPIPGGFVIDFVRLYEFVKNAIKPPADEDFVRADRMRIQREQWERFIKKGGE